MESLQLIWKIRPGQRSSVTNLKEAGLKLHQENTLLIWTRQGNLWKEEISSFCLLLGNIKRQSGGRSVSNEAPSLNVPSQENAPYSRILQKGIREILHWHLAETRGCRIFQAQQLAGTWTLPPGRNCRE